MSASCSVPGSALRSLAIHADPMPGQTRASVTVIDKTDGTCKTVLLDPEEAAIAGQTLIRIANRPAHEEN